MGKKGVGGGVRVLLCAPQLLRSRLEPRQSAGYLPLLPGHAVHAARLRRRRRLRRLRPARHSTLQLRQLGARLCARVAHGGGLQAQLLLQPLHLVRDGWLLTLRVEQPLREALER